MAEAATKSLREMLADVTLVDDPAEADYAILMISPSSGDYFSATSGYLELDICDGKVVCDVDDKCRPMATTHLATTLAGANRIAEIAQAVHANGGKVIANVNFTLAWLLGNVEPHVDALTAGYDKDQYMPDTLKDENGKAYAYRDTAGNYYELNFGLNY